ncbi:MAG: ROK family transcriptional regulator [Verrucomicrobiales bacterium]|jgi:predicted NBD/HSP70 family sugar kinase|nr:ROK family transcriptional regulator [Verrucomicrobiales bacterium]
MDPATLEHLIVKEVRKAKEISRRDLAVTLGIAKSTAGRRVDHMIERGMLRESGTEERREAGRPRRFLELRGEHGSFLGFDFDARHLFVVLLDFAQNTLTKRKIDLPPKPTKEEVIQLLQSEIEELTQSFKPVPVLGVGIGVPGQIRQEDRIGLKYPYITDWENVDLLAELDLRRSSLHIENNTRALALGEYWLGSHSGSPHLVCINVRTGISAAVIANGTLLAGQHEKAGEIRAWNVTGPDGARDWIERLGTVMAVSVDGGEKLWTKFVTACRADDKTTLEHLTEICIYHGDAAARITQLLDPEVIFFSGPFTELGNLYFDRVREAAATALDGHYFSLPEIRPVTLGEYAGAHGAAALAAAETRELFAGSFF